MKIYDKTQVNKYYINQRQSSYSHRKYGFKTQRNIYIYIYIYTHISCDQKTEKTRVRRITRNVLSKLGPHYEPNGKAKVNLQRNRTADF